MNKNIRYFIILLLLSMFCIPKKPHIWNPQKDISQTNDILFSKPLENRMNNASECFKFSEQSNADSIFIYNIYTYMRQVILSSGFKWNETDSVVYNQFNQIINSTGANKEQLLVNLCILLRSKGIRYAVIPYGIECQCKWDSSSQAKEFHASDFQNNIFNNNIYANFLQGAIKHEFIINTKICILDTKQIKFVYYDNFEFKDYYNYTCFAVANQIILYSNEWIKKYYSP